jgi:hypothetical protein
MKDSVVRKWHHGKVMIAQLDGHHGKDMMAQLDGHLPAFS